jgi:hypothetical protein
MAFERIHVSRPEPAELSQPSIDLLKWFRPEAVKAALCVHGGFDETGLAQHSQMLGHHRLWHTKLALDLSHRLLRRDEEAQDRAAVRFRNDFECRFHELYILLNAYACQDIYTDSLWKNMVANLLLKKFNGRIPLVEVVEIRI